MFVSSDWLKSLSHNDRSVSIPVCPRVPHIFVYYDSFLLNKIVQPTYDIWWSGIRTGYINVHAQLFLWNPYVSFWVRTFTCIRGLGGSVDDVYNSMLSTDRRIYKRMFDLHDDIRIGYRSYVTIIERAQRVNHLIPL